MVSVVQSLQFLQVSCVFSRSLSHQPSVIDTQRSIGLKFSPDDIVSLVKYRIQPPHIMSGLIILTVPLTGMGNQYRKNDRPEEPMLDAAMEGVGFIDTDSTSSPALPQARC